MSLERSRLRLVFQLLVLIGVAAGLWFAFPFAARFVEAAALNLRRFWWIVLLLGLGAWLIWTSSKRNPE
ncbi:MAG: hypothetical protein NDJ89_05325 [Oligoflexia bacterium]|nr:hypothetical protein [Oligoflexia bacterium]